MDVYATGKEERVGKKIRGERGEMFIPFQLLPSYLSSFLLFHNIPDRFKGIEEVAQGEEKGREGGRKQESFCIPFHKL